MSVCLGNEGLSSPTTPGTTAPDGPLPAPITAPERRVAPPTDGDVRWALHRAMWTLSPLRKVRTCRRFRLDTDEDGLPLRAVETDEFGGLNVGVGGLQTCATWHSCVCCGAKIAVGRARELAHAFEVWRALGGTVVLATFSLRHHLGHSLRKLIEGQRDGWKHVTSDRPWRRLRDRLGVRWVLRAFEATVGDEAGWHPHFHVFLLCDPREWSTTTVPWGEDGATRTVPDEPIGPPIDISQPFAAHVLTEAWTRWCDGLVPHGLDAVDYVERGGTWESAGFDVQVMDCRLGPEPTCGTDEEQDEGSAAALGRYPFKMALEAVGGVFKHGRAPAGHRHRTPFEVMETCAVALAEGDHQAADTDARLIKEWSETATDMRFRQCQWPPLMRRWFTEQAATLDIHGPLLDQELTEQELAEAEEAGSQTVAYLDHRDYGSTVVYELDTLQAAGRTGGMPAVIAWFQVRGLPLDVTDHGAALCADHPDQAPPTQRSRDRKPDDTAGTDPGPTAGTRPRRRQGRPESRPWPGAPSCVSSGQLPP